MPTGKTALVLGGSGLVGGELLRALLADDRYAKVIALVRRDLPLEDPKLEQVRIDFDAIGEIPAGDDLFSALGTTIGKAESQAAFRKVDFDYVHTVALAARNSGTRQFLLVSSIGAASDSRIFYNRVKGEIEDAVGKIGFDGTQIFRPSILTGNRSENRPAERISIAVMGALSWAMVGPLRRYRPIAAATVARAMVAVATAAPSGFNLFESDAIEEIARRSASGESIPS
jgi:uncharacterized protein YbjT (DUF2867 family)